MAFGGLGPLYSSQVANAGAGNPIAYGNPTGGAQPSFGGAQPGVGTQGEGPFGGFISGVGRHLGLGGPRQISGVDVPQISRDDYMLGGSTAASNALLDQFGGQGQAFLGRGTGLGLGGYNSAMRASSGLRADEGAYQQRLEAMANGQGPSVAQAQYLQAADDATRRASGMAFAARGGMGLLGARQASEVQFQGAQQAATQAGLQRQQEMLGATQQLGQWQAQRAGLEAQRAGLGLGGAQAQLAQQSANDAAYGNEMSRYMQVLQGNQQGLMGYNAQGSNNYLQAAGLNAQIAQQNMAAQQQADQRRANLLKSAAGGVFGAAKGLFGM
jgi:hypothetical protein